MSKVTIRDIAQMAGVSVGTVSRVLNKADNIDPEIYSRTMDMVRRYKYKPGKRGRRPVGIARPVSTRHIALWSPNMSPSWQGNEMWSMYIGGIEKACSSRGYDLVIKMSDANNDFVHEATYSGNYAGVIVKMSARLDQIPAMKKLFEKVPSVGFGLNMPNYKIPQICLDNHAAGQLAVISLLDMGHRDIAFFNLDPNHRMLVARSHGYMEIMKERGLYKPEYMYEHETTVRQYPIEPDTSIPDCSEAVKYLKSLKKLPTAVIMANDWSALGFLKACNEAGIKVPDEISVVSIDDIGSLCTIATPGLSAVAMPFAELTEYAGNMLIDSIESPDIYFARHPSAQYLPGKFVERESTKKV
jgi:LacI family transcriptional regulator